MDADGMPISIEMLRQYFNVMLKIDERGDHLALKVINREDHTERSAPEVHLDPATMLIVD